MTATLHDTGGWSVSRNEFRIAKAGSFKVHVGQELLPAEVESGTTIWRMAM